jgi:hypothetical protein
MKLPSGLLFPLAGSPLQKGVEKRLINNLLFINSKRRDFEVLNFSARTVKVAPQITLKSDLRRPPDLSDKGEGVHEIKKEVQSAYGGPQDWGIQGAEKRCIYNLILCG